MACNLYFPGVTTLTRKAGKRTPERIEHWHRDGKTWTRLAGHFNPNTGEACATFKADYAAARNGQPTPSRATGRPVPVKRMDADSESFAWLCSRFYKSPEFNRFAKATTLRRYLDEVCHLHELDTGTLRGETAFATWKKSNIKAIRDQVKDSFQPARGHKGERVPDGSGKADDVVNAVKRLFSYAVEENLCTGNPAFGVERIRTNREKGHPAMKWREVLAYRARHPLGSNARLHFEFCWGTLARISDAPRFCPKWLDDGDGRFLWTEAKGMGSRVIGNSAPKAKEQVMRPSRELLAAIAAMPVQVIGDTPYLRQDNGRPFCKRELGRAARKWFDEAGLPNLSTHSIRKGRSVWLATNKASATQKRLAGNWTNGRQADFYEQQVEHIEVTDSVVDMFDQHAVSK